MKNKTIRKKFALGIIILFLSSGCLSVSIVGHIFYQLKNLSNYGYNIITAVLNQRLMKLEMAILLSKHIQMGIITQKWSGLLTLTVNMNGLNHRHMKSQQLI